MMGCWKNDDWKERHSPAAMAGAIAAAVAIGIAMAFALGWIVMLLWNWLAPGIFNLRRITYWEGWGLLILCQILFKSGGYRGGRRGRARGDGEWRRAMRDRFRSCQGDGSRAAAEGKAPDGGTEGL
jgi:hypothetical protein